MIQKWNNGFNVGHCLEDFSLELDSGNMTADFINTTYPVNPLGFYSSVISPGDTLNVHVEYVNKSAAPILSLISEAANACSFFSTPSGDTLKADLSWIPSSYDSRRQPYSFIFRGESPLKDLTYLVYVSGLQIDTCSLIGVDDLKLENLTLSIFPNPAIDFLEIELSSELRDKKENFVLKYFIFKCY